MTWFASCAQEVQHTGRNYDIIQGGGQKWNSRLHLNGEPKMCPMSWMTLFPVAPSWMVSCMMVSSKMVEPRQLTSAGCPDYCEEVWTCSLQTSTPRDKSSWPRKEITACHFREVGKWINLHMTVWEWLTLNVRGPSYLGLTRSISWLLMPWHLTSPGHQQPWYWLYRMWRSFSYLR